MTGRRYHLDIEDRAEGDADERMVSTIALLQSRGYEVEGPRELATRLRRRERDEYLREACSLLPGTVWAQCVALEREIAKFESIIWPRLRDYDAPPEGCSRLRRCLFLARQLGALPTTARQISNIAAKRAAGGDFGETPL